MEWPIMEMHEGQKRGLVPSTGNFESTGFRMEGRELLELLGERRRHSRAQVSSLRVEGRQRRGDKGAGEKVGKGRLLFEETQGEPWTRLLCQATFQLPPVPPLSQPPTGHSHTLCPFSLEHLTPEQPPSPRPPPPVLCL